MTSAKSAGRDLTSGPVLSSIFLFALPIMGSSLFQKLYNTIDTMVVGSCLGETALAAMGAASPVYSLLVALALGMGNGIAIVTARSFGRKDSELLKRTIAAALLIAAATGLVITGAAQLLTVPLLRVMQTPDSILEEAHDYIRVISLFTLVTLAYNLCSGILRAVGNSRMPLVFLIVSSVLNVLLDLFFVAVLGFGIRGAAIATVISQLVSVVLCLTYVFLRARFLIPGRRDFRPERALCREIFTQGLSMGIMECLVDIGSVVLQYGINGMGEMVIAAHTTARKVFMLCNIPITGMASASSTFLSQNRGADRPDRIRTAIRQLVLYYLGAAALLTLLLFIAGPLLIRTVSGSRNEELLLWGVRYVRFVAPCYFFLGTLFLFRYALQAVGSKIIPPLSSVIEMGGKILFVVLLIPRFGYWAVICCEPAMWVLTTAVLAVVFFRNPYIRGSGRNRSGD